MTREAAFRAGFENPLIGANAPLQRLYGTVTALGEELAGSDMGTPVGTRFRERQATTKTEVKRLQKLREQFPEEFGRGQMLAQEEADPYMLGLGTMPMGMRPGVAAGPRELAGLGGRPMLPAPGMLEGEIMPPRAGYLGAPPPAGPRGLPPAAPPAPYYRTVPPEMGTSMRPMTPFQQNQVGLATGRFGPSGYAPEMAVTDFETYGPMRARGTPGPYAPSGFDRNMLEAFRAGRANYGRNVRPEPMGGGFTLEELGQAVVPYRQGGLTYEPVGMAPQGGSNLPAFAAGRSLRPTMLEGEFREIPGIGYGGGQRALPGGQGYGGGMDFGVTREGMAAAPSGLPYGRAAALGVPGAAIGMYGIGAQDQQAAAPEARRVLLPPIDIGVSQPLQAAPRMYSPLYGPQERPTPQAATAERRAPAGKRTAAAKAKAQPAAAAPAEEAFEPNLNYLVTEALDRILGQREAERGREYQQYYQRQGYY